MSDYSLPRIKESALPEATNVDKVRVLDSTGKSVWVEKEDLPITETQVTGLTDDLALKADKSVEIIAGAGLTGGGALSGDVTLNVITADDSLVVAADNIKVNTVDSLTSDSATRPLSAKQGKALDDVDKANYAKSVEMIAHDAEAPSPVIPTGTTKTYEFSSGGSCSWITGGAVTVEKGDKVEVAFTAPSTFVRTYQIDGARSTVGDISTLKASDNTSLVTILSPVLGTEAAIQDNGYVADQYYAGTSVSNIGTNTGSKRYLPIDLSSHIGKPVVIKIRSTNQASTRKIGYGSEDNMITVRNENTFCSIGSSFISEEWKIYPTLENHFLYISFSSEATLLSIVVEDKGKIDEVGSTLYVDATNGNDSNIGSSTKPLATIKKAVQLGGKTIYIAPGTYAEEVVIIGANNVSLIRSSLPAFSVVGGYDKYVTIDGGGTRNSAITMINCNSVRILGIEAKNTYNSSFYIENCQDVEMNYCSAHDNVHADRACGVQAINTDIILRNCIAYNVRLDGFNFHGYGVASLYDCTAHDCDEDGVSHHDSYCGHIIGGEYYNCGKGGVSSPTFGANIDILNVYSHNNVYGLYSVAAITDRQTKSIISGCCFKENTTYDIRIDSYINVVGINNKYTTKSVGANSTFDEY